MLITCLNGSPNKKGDTVFLINSLKEKIEELGGECQIIHAGEVLNDCKTPFCVGCSRPCNGNCFANTKLEEAYNLISKADCLVVASPVYFGSVSAQIKAFFDKSIGMRKTKEWIGKKAAGMSVGHSKYGGQELTVETIKNILSVHGFTLINDGHKEFNAGHFGVCAQNPVSEDKDALESIKVLAHRIMEK